MLPILSTDKRLTWILWCLPHYRMRCFLTNSTKAIGAETWTEFQYLMPDAELAELIERHNEDCGYEQTFLIPRPTERFEFS
jgi:hypothetical protein